jgi:hypothetical protein
MKVLRVILTALDLVVVAILGALVVFVAAVLAVAILDQRKPPYPV